MTKPHFIPEGGDRCCPDDGVMAYIVDPYINREFVFFKPGRLPNPTPAFRMILVFKVFQCTLGLQIQVSCQTRI